MEGKFGVYTNKPKKIAQKVGELLSDPLQLKAMGERATRLSRPQATKEIATDFATVLLNEKRRW